MIVVFATFAVQAIVAILSGVIFLGFSRHYRRGYLLQWTRSWFALAVYLVYGALGLALAQELPVDSPVRVAVSLLSAVAGYVQVAWLLFGTYELATGEPVPRQQGRALVAAFVVLGALTALLYVWDPNATAARHLLRVAVRCGVLAAAFLIAARVVWKTIDRSARALGQRLVSIAFLLFGIEQIHLALANTAMATGNVELGYTSYLGFVDVLLQFAIVLGLVIWLLEDERKTSEEASAQVEHLAYHDVLTGLPNRQLLRDRLDRALATARRHGGELGVLFLDIDRFKVITNRSATPRATSCCTASPSA